MCVVRPVGLDCFFNMGAIFSVTIDFLFQIVDYASKQWAGVVKEYVYFCCFESLAHLSQI